MRASARTFRAASGASVHQDTHNTTVDSAMVSTTYDTLSFNSQQLLCCMFNMIIYYAQSTLLPQCAGQISMDNNIIPIHLNRL